MATENKGYIRRSNAAGKHADDKRTRRTRFAAKLRAVRESGSV